MSSKSKKEVDFTDWMDLNKSKLEGDESPFRGDFENIRYQLSMVHRIIGITGITFKGDNGFLLEYGEITRSKNPESSRQRFTIDDQFKEELDKQQSLKDRHKKV